MLKAILTAIALVALSAWATGAASAQEPFVAIDASLDAEPAPANAYADILEARVERVDDKMLRMGLTIAVLPEMTPGTAYGIVVSDGVRSWYGALAAIPEPTYLYGKWAGDEPGDSEQTTGAIEVGAPGLIAIDVPIAGLPGAMTLTSLRAMALDLKGEVTPTPVPTLTLDEVEAAGAFVVREQEAAPVTTVSTAAAGGSSSASSDAPAAQTEPVDVQPQEQRAQTPGLGVAALVVTLAVVAWRRRC